MISLKGLLLGLGLSVVGALVFAVYTLHVLAPGQFFTQGPQTGVDVRVLQWSVLHSPTYWLMVLLLLAVGYAIIYSSHRPTTPTR